MWGHAWPWCVPEQGSAPGSAAADPRVPCFSSKNACQLRLQNKSRPAQATAREFFGVRFQGRPQVCSLLLPTRATSLSCCPPACLQVPGWS